MSLLSLCAFNMSGFTEIHYTNNNNNGTDNVSQHSTDSNDDRSPHSTDDFTEADIPEHESHYSNDDDVSVENIPGPTVDMSFLTLKDATKYLRKWMEHQYCPLIKIRKEFFLEESDGQSKGRLCLQCTHGRNRKSNATYLRPTPHVKFTGCRVIKKRLK